MDNVTANDVILTSGCSMAIEMAIKALANPGENILIPKPAWHYTTWIIGSNIEAQFYDLDANNDWEIDLKHMESLINDKTRAILVNSPGNPCGNVFSMNHILEILKIAEKHCLPIISDEVYEFLTFADAKHYSFASLSKNVPILVCSGLTKRFLIPAIRLGWIVINDRGNKLNDVRKGLINMAGRGFGPNSTIQLALPNILNGVPDTFFTDVNARVHVSHHITFYESRK
jgi:tyrosine aminotransferase